MERTRISYPDRFDPEYLSLLKENLSLESLKKTALHEEKIINGVSYKWCISIEFCGLAATTLFYSNPGSPSVTTQNVMLRKEIWDIFKDLLTPEKVRELNEGLFYLRVKFCFAYLYSDFPICLMKAELPEVWKFQANKPVEDFHINYPLREKEFDRSTIKESQIHSLRMIARILDENKDLIFLGGKEKNVNTIQVRFSVIPSPVCVLIINDTAFCDPYLYSVQGDDKQLEFTYPVSVVQKNGEETSKGFANVRKHMNYLWRHDLTLFCKDATGFEPPDDIGNLDKILSPEMIIGPKGTRWGHKATRIWQKKVEMAGGELKMTPADEEKINLWKTNLTDKFSLCTRKLKHKNDLAENNECFLTIGMKRKFFYFRLEIRKTNTVFEYLRHTHTLIFCVLAHYSYATLTGDDPVLHDHYPHSKSKLRNEIAEQLNSCDLDQNNGGSIYIDELFPIQKNFSLNIPMNNIDFDETEFEEIGKATYHTGHEAELTAEDILKRRKDKNNITKYEERSCLSYEKP